MSAEPAQARAAVTSGRCRCASAAIVYALALLTLTLAGCDLGIDPDQARLCRIALVALEPDGAIEITHQSGTVNAGGGMSSVRLDYGLVAPEAPRRKGFLECQFAGSGAQPLDLVGARMKEGALSLPRLFVLQRYWLGTPEADRADPEPVFRLAAAPLVSPITALVLQYLMSALPSIATYGLLAAAYSLIYGLIGRINLAFGAYAAIGAWAGLIAVAAVSSPSLVIAAGAALAAALWAAVWHGVAIARWIFAPLRRATGQQGLVATVGLALVLDEYLRLAQGPVPRWITPLRIAPVAVARSPGFSVTVTPMSLMIAFVSSAAALMLLLVMARTQFGRDWRATSDDAGAAALLGVDPNATFVKSFALASALAGASGGIVVLTYGSFGPALGATLGLKALLAAVLGGVGSVPGALLGGLALGVLEALWSAFFPIEQRDLVVFVVLVVALIGCPGGLLGYRDGAPRRV